MSGQLARGSPSPPLPHPVRLRPPASRAAGPTWPLYSPPPPRATLFSRLPRCSPAHLEPGCPLSAVPPLCAVPLNLTPPYVPSSPLLTLTLYAPHPMLSFEHSLFALLPYLSPVRLNASSCSSPSSAGRRTLTGFSGFSGLRWLRASCPVCTQGFEGRGLPLPKPTPASILPAAILPACGSCDCMIHDCTAGPHSPGPLWPTHFAARHSAPRCSAARLLGKRHLGLPSLCVVLPPGFTPLTLL